MTGQSNTRARRGLRNQLPGNILRQNLSPGRYNDGGGLYLLVRENGQSWVLFFNRHGKRREMGLGPAGDKKGQVSLVEARRSADEARAIVQQGGDPIAHRKHEADLARRAGQDEASQIVTFGQMADAYLDGGKVGGKQIAGQASGFRNDKHVAQWRMTLGDAYCSSIRSKAVAEISTEDVLGILQPIWQSKNETASRIRGRIERVLDAAKAAGFREGENPARWRGHLALLLPKRQKLQRGHHAALPYKELPDFVAQLRTRDNMSSIALEFLILTAARSGEVRGAEWAEFDLDQAVWTIPANRMKAGREHRVPLTDRALEILSQATQLSGDEGLVFTSGRGQMSDMTLSALLKRMGHSDVTVHGFRSSFRDWAFEVSRYPRDIAEAALAHVFGDATERAYRRGDALEKRRRMMADWGAFVGKEVGKVVRLPRARRDH
ncbi:tyrosine-type recombinase/integrase [Cucumibacter marinus]|uniref:tyrosine-type recombinase/integrase n=1 Tax=Cucumibacter marinus TaxID=1121252 RepID=UPI0004037ADD|nr:site-specific integrase [Cucumibacter marinus]